VICRSRTSFHWINPAINIIIIFWHVYCFVLQGRTSVNFLMMEIFGRTDHIYFDHGVLSCCLLFAGSQRGVERCSSLLMKYSPRRCGPSSVDWGSESPPNNSELGVFDSPPL